jgi:hypothetical protein
MAAAHRSAPSPSPVRPVERRGHATSSTRIAAGPLPAIATPLMLSHAVSAPLSPPHSRPPRGVHPRLPLPWLAQPPLKRESPAAAAFSSLFFLPRSPLRMAKRATSRPRRRSSHRGPPQHVSHHRRCHFPPSTVRPVNPPPFPDLGPPHLSRPTPQLLELARVTADPPSSEDAIARHRTKPPLRPIVTPPPR